MQLDITLDILRKEFPLIFDQIEAIQEESNWQATINDASKFMAEVCCHDYDDTMRDVLRKNGTRIKNGYIMRDYRLRGWEVDGQPALSYTIKSRVLYLQNVQVVYKQGIDILISRSSIRQTHETLVQLQILLGT